METLLPIGTVCMLKNTKKKIMITGYLMENTKVQGVVHDYIGCVFPEGVLNTKKNLLFNHDDIENIFHKGYINEESEKFINEVSITKEQQKSSATKIFEDVELL